MEILKKPIVKDVITNVIYMLLVIIYFICFNTQVTTLEQAIMIRYIDISSIAFVGIAIILFELGYDSSAYTIVQSDSPYYVTIFNDNEVDKWCLKNACLKVNDLSQCLIVKSSENSRRIDGAVCGAILYETYRQNRTEWTQMIGGVK